jgi:predicted dehydrogenase
MVGQAATPKAALNAGHAEKRFPIRRTTRRKFISLSSAALAGISIIPREVLGAKDQPAANDKLNIACIGVAGMQGKVDVRGVSHENIYALCDVDRNHLEKIAALYPKAKIYTDYRAMLDKEAKNLDGITITTPDHSHANIAMHAIQLGIPVFCQKPMTHTIWEARQLQNAARKNNVITQMGNQGYSSEGIRLACEILWNGMIGDVTEVHSGFDKRWAAKIKEWPAAKPVPEYLDWDLWLNRTQERPYFHGVHPQEWRGFWDFGSQMIGDWGVHMLGPAHWGLALRNPISVECFAIGEVNPVTYPPYACKIEFPERTNPFLEFAKLPATTVYWYEGGMMKNIYKLPEELEPGTISPRKFNALFKGSKKYMATGGRGDRVRLVPESEMKGFTKPPRVLDRVKGGHYRNWTTAIKEGKKPCSNFDVAAPFVEWLLLGTIACRFPHEKLLWDAKNLRFTNNDAANEFVKPAYRKGWEIPEIKG